MFGGELLKKEYYEKIALDSKCTIINTYGPTEATITSTVNIIQNDNITIGVPISNSRAYVLDKRLRVLPVGAIGELYIGGIGLARAYLNQPQLTAERFIANPFQSVEEKAQAKNTKLYKTGAI